MSIFDFNFINGETPLNAEHLNPILQACDNLNSALATKADTSTVSVALAEKAGTSEVNAALATKADTSTVTAALSGKQDSLVSGTNIKTVAGQSILGAGEIDLAEYDEAVKRIGIVGRVWEESMMSDFSYPGARRLAIEGVTSWDDLLNLPLYIKSRGVDLDYLKINTLDPKPFAFQSASKPLSWSTAGQTYTATYNGTTVVVIS